MAALVLDSSVMMSWLLKETPSAVSVLALDTTVDEGAIAPAILYYECRNVLLVKVRKKKLTLEQAKERMALAMDLAIGISPFDEHQDLLSIADRTGLSVYDAAYLDLAIQRHLPLASLDKRLCQAAESEGVPLFGSD